MRRPAEVSPTREICGGAINCDNTAGVSTRLGKLAGSTESARPRGTLTITAVFSAGEDFDWRDSPVHCSSRGQQGLQPRQAPLQMQRRTPPAAISSETVHRDESTEVGMKMLSQRNPPVYMAAEKINLKVIMSDHPVYVSRRGDEPECSQQLSEFVSRSSAT